MSLNDVNSGRDVPNDFNVIIEIPMNADPIKYEVDKESGAIFVDRFMGTAMHYPCNYGYVPQTLAGDGDPCDVLVITPFALIPGVVVRCRALGVLKMTDDGGGDAKVIAVPYKDPRWQHIQDVNDIPEYTRKEIEHFFEHYKDLEPGKWVKVIGWGDKAEAEAILLTSLEAVKAKA